MTSFFRLSWTFLLLWIAITPGWALNVKPTQHTLKNGMRVIVIPDRRAPIVTHMVWYRVGSADEPAGKTGLAHYFEHLMFQGTKSLPPAEFSRIIERLGGQDNAFTSFDYTAYYQRIAARHLGRVMAMEAERMQNLQLSQKEVDTEREVIKEERRLRTDNNPRALFGERLRATLYLAHPYRRPVIGWMDDVERLKLKDAMAFYRRHYTPANAIVVIVGDVDPAEAIRLAEEHYGKLKNTAEVEERVRTAEPPLLTARRVVMRDQRIRTPAFQRMWVAPSYRTAKNGAAHAWEVFAQGFGGGATSLIYRTLVVKEKIATNAGAWYSGDGRDYGEFGIYATPAPGVSPDKLEARIDRLLAEVKRQGLPQADIEHAINVLTAEAVYALDSQFGLARMFGSTLAADGTADDVLKWEERLRAVNAEHIRRVLAALPLEKHVTGWLLPATRADTQEQEKEAVR